MNYQKPEIVLMTSAIRGIQGCGEKSIVTADCNPHDDRPTAGAYEADE